MLRGSLELCKSAIGDGKTARDADQAALQATEYDFAKIRCPKCRSRGTLSPHDNYTRHFIYRKDGHTQDEIITITRLMCDSCNTTHALLPLPAIPYLAYSVCFIAALIADWIDNTYSSIESLSDAYGISQKTFFRLRKNFAASVSLVCGRTGLREKMRQCALKLGSKTIDAVAATCFEFLTLAGRSFCESLPP
jgi:transposase-like protein